MKYTQISSTTFQELQMNAGILVDSFDPDTGTIGNILGSTTGGVVFTDAPSFVDFADDIDNAPRNMKELKRIESRTVTMSGTFVTVSAETVRMLAGTADIDSTGVTRIVPRDDLLSSDFIDLWWIGDYSDVNTGDSAGFLAINLKNALNTSGFQITSSDNGKGNFAFEFTGHYSVEAQDEVPYVVYVKAGEPTPSIKLDKTTLDIAVGEVVTLHATGVPNTETITWASSASGKASVNNNGVVTGAGTGSATITATLGTTGKTATCAVTIHSAT